MSNSSLTERAVGRWLAALPAARYDVRVVPAEGDGPSLKRCATAEGVKRLIPWLRARNATGFHIYGRPSDPTYVLIDDLDEDGLDRLYAAGHRASAVVVTSPSNHQAWLRLPTQDGSITSELSSAAARFAARSFDGDLGAASAFQVGRIPGFTNIKAAYADRSGRGPYVVLRTAAALVDTVGENLLCQAAKHLAKYSDPVAVSAGPASFDLHKRYRLRVTDPYSEWQEGCRRVKESCSIVTMDRSRLDYAIAVRLFERGANTDYIRKVLLAGERASELGLSAMKYVNRTLASAKVTAVGKRVIGAAKI